MPAKVGAVKVINVSSSGIFNIGDVYSMNPESSAKTYAGGGSFNSGDGIRVNLANSTTYVYDPDQVDQSITS
ncbi:spore gernimation protein GerPA [Oceanobacillus picturae]|jgi:spore germination protein PA|uniref:Spore germination protein n=2 Tax=Oceanobacillus TaxID=182709 RepID=A0AAW5B194_9BACI|nr:MULTISPECIES: spore germination protein [Oceanobacillus]AVQ98623.1 spore germination protein [Oceanobacillus iheyensis]NAP00027.1 spore germination protein [Halomonas sp. MG34]MCG3418434.1 spore germination protein [Oceanobacillus jordanicus]RIU90696.1 spore germination protein [Oceanobacillus picturae]CDO02700.1 putative spore germination protein GerPA [Oceanobacillus picturae]